MKYLVIAASHRPDSYNRRLAAMAAEQLQANGAEIDFPDYSEMELPLFNDHAREQGNIPPHAHVIARRIAGADGLVIASPEYNWSIPGSLKNTIDWVSHFRPVPFAGKSALLLCATPGKRGGAVGLTHLKTVLEANGVYVLPGGFTMGDAHSQFAGASLVSKDLQRRFSVTIDAYKDFSTRFIS